jgi:hypothetical protein
MKAYDRADKAYNQYRDHRMSICATLYQSLSAYKRNEEAGALWRFIKGVIQGVGYSDAMTHLTNLYQFRIDSAENLVTD